MDNNYQIVKNALSKAQSPDIKAPQAHFGVLRQAFSLSFVTLGTSGTVKGSIEKIEFDLNRRVKQPGAPFEILLEEADGFIATHLRFSLIKRATAEVLDQSRQQFFANPLVFSASDGTAAKVNTIYTGGKLKIQVGGNDWNKEGLSMKAFERSYMFNQGMQIVADTPDASLPTSAYDGIFDGAVPLIPGFLFGGKKGNKITIELAQATLLTDGTTATTENVAVLEVIGVYCPNVAHVLDQKFLTV